MEYLAPAMMLAFLGVVVKTMLNSNKTLKEVNKVNDNISEFSKKLEISNLEHKHERSMMENDYNAKIIRIQNRHKDMKRDIRDLRLIIEGKGNKND